MFHPPTPATSASASAGPHDPHSYSMGARGSRITGSTIAHVDDITDSGEGEVADLLRPFYLDYLMKHGVDAPTE